MPTVLREQPQPVQPLRTQSLQSNSRLERTVRASVTRAMTWEAQRKSVPDREHAYKGLEAKSSTGEDAAWQEGRLRWEAGPGLLLEGPEASQDFQILTSHTHSTAVSLLSLPLAWGLPWLINFVSRAL